MATRAAPALQKHEEYRASLTRTVHIWERRRRGRQFVYWLPVSIALGLMVGIVIALIARAQPLFLPLQVALLAAGAVGLMILALGLIFALWPRPQIESARNFDLLFDLKERTSTALELLDGHIITNEELTSYQVMDAVEQAQAINPADKLPYRVNWRLWIAVPLLLFALVILLILPNPQTDTVNRNTAQRTAISAAEEELDRITEEVAGDATLAEEERQDILEELEDARETLAREDVSPEEAVATLNDAQSELQEQADTLQEQSEAQREALREASEALREVSAPPEESEAQPPQAGDAAPTLQEIREQVPGMNDQQMQSTAAALDAAADALEQTNPDAAEALRDAADSLRQGDRSAANDAMERAEEMLRDANAEANRDADAAQNLQEAADSLGEDAERIAGEPGESPPDMSEGGAGSEGLEELQPQAGNPGGDPNAQGQPDAQGEPARGEGDEPGAGGQVPVQPAPGDAEGDLSLRDQPGTGPGAGDAPGGAGSDDRSPRAAEGEVPDANNDPDGRGVGEFEPVFAPQRIGGSGTDEIFLEPDASDVPSREGEFSENPAGESIVPYTEVLSDYSNAASRALETDYIPLGLRDVVREYFSSLEPGQ